MNSILTWPLHWLLSRFTSQKDRSCSSQKAHNQLFVLGLNFSFFDDDIYDYDGYDDDNVGFIVLMMTTKKVELDWCHLECQRRYLVEMGMNKGKLTTLTPMRTCIWERMAREKKRVTRGR